jgi:hypothetical protein
VTAEQRRQLIRRDSKPWLDFDVKPYGLEPGARYVLQWQRGSSHVVVGPNEEPYVFSLPRHPVWWIEITDVVRHRKGFWRARYDMFDLRDPTLYLARGRGYTSSRHRAIDDACVYVDSEVRAKAVEEFEVSRRSQRSKAHRKRAA